MKLTKQRPFVLFVAPVFFAAFISVELHAQTRPSRASMIARAQMWAPTDIAGKNLRLGPAEFESHWQRQSRGLVESACLEDLMGRPGLFASGGW